MEIGEISCNIDGATNLQVFSHNTIVTIPFGIVTNQEVKSSTYKQAIWERLRLILEGEQGREVSLSEASEIGSSLLSFFATLAEGSDNLLSDDMAS